MRAFICNWSFLLLGLSCNERVSEGISKIPFGSKLHDSAFSPGATEHREGISEQPERPTQREILGAAKVRSYQIGLEELNAEPGQL